MSILDMVCENSPFQTWICPESLFLSTSPSPSLYTVSSLCTFLILISACYPAISLSVPSLITSLALKPAGTCWGWSTRASRVGPQQRRVRPRRSPESRAEIYEDFADQGQGNWDPKTTDRGTWRQDRNNDGNDCKRLHALMIVDSVVAGIRNNDNIICMSSSERRRPNTFGFSRYIP